METLLLGRARTSKIQENNNVATELFGFKSKKEKPMHRIHAGSQPARKTYCIKPLTGSVARPGLSSSGALEIPSA